MDVAARVTSKGQVTVPKVVREALGIEAGDEVVFRVEGSRAVVAKTANFLDLAGTVKVPAAKRNAAWDEVLRKTKTKRDAAAPMNVFLDTNVLVRHLTGDPPEMAARATAALQSASELLLPDLVAVETIYLLESFSEVLRGQVAEALRSLIGFDSVTCVDPRCCCGRLRSTRLIALTSPRPTSSPAPKAPTSEGSSPSTDRSTES